MSKKATTILASVIVLILIAILLILAGTMMSFPVS
jgi:hypothetical protein